ncbi:MAG: autotransporter domain-containing protein [Puniceicoccales bacterium]|jgi:outer membrane autotransporter protein|nr:autotransporter domain-containing protein [Puniceicoccales bacterium]
MKNSHLSAECLLHAASRLLAISTVSVATAIPLVTPVSAAEAIAISNGDTLSAQTLAGETVFQLGDALNFSAQAGPVSGTGTFVLLGGPLGGVLTLTDVNSYRGATAVKNATLRLGANAKLGGDAGVYTGKITIYAGAELDVFQAGDQVFSGAISGDGRLSKSGAGRLVLSGDNTQFVGTLAATKGTLSANSAKALGKGDILLNGATLELTGARDSVYNNNLTIGAAGATLALATPNATATTAIRYSGEISGSGRLVKTGGQRLEVNGTISAPFTLREGTLGGTGNILQPTFEAGTTISPATATALGTLRLGNGAANAVSFSDINFGLNVTASGTSDRLAVNGGATYGPGNVITFSAAASTREYVIIAATGKIMATAEALASTSFVWGNDPVDNSTRKKAALKIVDAPLPADAEPDSVAGQNLVLATYTSANLRLLWNGTAATDIEWTKGPRELGENPVADPWKEGEEAGRWFQDGDMVEFGDVPRVKKSLEVATAGGGVVVGGIRVTGTGYTFNGGKITASLTATRSPDFNADGILDVAAGASVTFNNPVEFRGGIHVAGDVVFNQATSTGKSDLPLVIAEGGSVTFQNGAAIEISGGAKIPAIENEGRLVFSRDTGSDFTFKAALSGAGDVEKRGTGKLYFTGTNNTSTGKLTILEGTFVYQKDTNLGTGENVLDGGTLSPAAGTYNKPWTLAERGGVFAIASGNVRFAQATLKNTDPETGETTITPNPDGPFGVISGPGALTKTGAGNLHLDSGSQHEGATNVLGGNLYVNGTLGTDGAYAANITLDGGNFHLNNEQPQTLSGALFAAAQKDAQGNVAVDEEGRALHPGGIFNKRGQGILTLSGAEMSRKAVGFNNFEGQTTSESPIIADAFANGSQDASTPRATGVAPDAVFTGPSLDVGTLVNHTDAELRVATVTASQKVDNSGDYHVATTRATLNNTASGRIYLDHAEGARNSVITTLANDGSVYFDTTVTGQRLTLTNLSNKTSRGTGRFYNYLLDNSDNPNAANSSILEIKGGTLSGNHIIYINLPEDTGFGEIDKHYTRELVKFTSGGTMDPQATLRVGNLLESGIYRLNVAGAGNSTLRVIGYSSMGNALVASTAAVSLGWFSQLDNVTKRLGELRCGIFTPETERNPDERLAEYEARRDHTAAAGSEFGIWARGYGSRTDVNLDTPGISTFSEFQYGGDVGSDMIFSPGANHRLILGAFVGFQGARRNINDASGSVNFTRSVLGGAYLNWVHKDGWYAGLLLKGQSFFNETRAGLDTSKNAYDTAGFGGGVEFGKQITLGKSWFVEPAAQIEYFELLSQKFTTKRTETQTPYEVRLDSASGVRFASHIRAGVNLDLQTNGVLQPYLRIGAEYQFTDGGGITALRQTVTPDYDDWRVRGAIGAAWQIENNIAVHAEYEAAYGDKTEVPWGVNAGFRFRF